MNGRHESLVILDRGKHLNPKDANIVEVKGPERALKPSDLRVIGLGRAGELREKLVTGRLRV